MNLSEILSEIKNVKPFAEENVEEGARETLNARRGRKSQSIETLKRLKRQYTAALRQTATFIFVVGSEREKFTSIGVESFKCFSSDPEAFFTDLADRVPQSLYLGKESLSNLFDILGRHLEDKASELDIVGYPQLVFKQEYAQHLTSRQDFLNVVKKAVVDQVGGELVGIHAAASLVNQAIERNHTSKVTPILLASGDEKFVLKVSEAMSRLSNKIFIVTAGESTLSEDVIAVPEVTNDSVKKALKNINANLKTK